ncbi:MAG: hypothetical protein H6620_12655 [Halobacteriovoraceae bacterium]|nr:hypothetical protein [Halobacteriovoraceae bacterium]
MNFLIRNNSSISLNPDQFNDEIDYYCWSSTETLSGVQLPYLKSSDLLASLNNQKPVWVLRDVIFPLEQPQRRLDIYEDKVGFDLAGKYFLKSKNIKWYHWSEFHSFCKACL